MYDITNTSFTLENFFYKIMNIILRTDTINHEISTFFRNKVKVPF